MISCYLFFLYAYNHKDAAAQMVKILVWVGFFFALFSVIFRIFNLGLWPLFSALDGSQFVYPLFGSHNHLGDFLLIPLIVFLYALLKKSLRLETFLAFLLVFIFFIFSYSKSAYLDLLLAGTGLFFYIRQQRGVVLSGRLVSLLAFIVIVVLGFFFITVKDLNSLPPFSSLRLYAQNSQTLSSRTVDSGRFDFVTQGLKSVAAHPLFGIGADNFLYASMKYVDLSYWTFTSHNLFFDAAVGQGVLASMLLLLFFGIILIKSRKTLVYFLFLAVLLNFQTDYTFLISSFLVLLFILGGFVYEEKKEIAAPLVLLISFLLLFVVQDIFLSGYLADGGKYSKSLALYPLQAGSYEPLINDYQASGNTGQANHYLMEYLRYFPGDPSTLSYAGSFYEKQRDLKNAKKYYQASYEAYAFGNLQVTEKLYAMHLVDEGSQSAKRFADSFFKHVEQVEKAGGLPLGYRLEVSKFCQRVYRLHCPYLFEF